MLAINIITSLGLSTKINFIQKFNFLSLKSKKFKKKYSGPNSKPAWILKLFYGGVRLLYSEGIFCASLF